MTKNLYKFLLENGTDAILEYGELPIVRKDANCCSWATGDLLFTKFWSSACFVGRFNSVVNNDCHLGYTDIEKAFKGNNLYSRMLNNHSFFIHNNKNEIPKSIPTGYFMVAVLMHKTAYDYHFIRMHENNVWSHRAAGGYKISLLNEGEEINKTDDLLNSLVNGNDYIFRGYFAVPEIGMKNGMDDTIAEIYPQISKDIKAVFSQRTLKFIEELKKFSEDKNKLINNFYGFDNLNSNYLEIRQNLNDKVNNNPFNTIFDNKNLYYAYAGLIQALLLKYNKKRIKKIITEKINQNIIM